MQAFIEQRAPQSQCRTYFTLFKYLAPLALTTLALDIAEQALYRGLSSSVHAVNNLAAFGIAYTFIKLLIGATTDFRHASLVLASSQKDLRKMMYIASVTGAFILGFSLLVGLTPVGIVFIDKVFDVSPSIGSLARKTFTYLSVFPLLDAQAAVFTGILLQHKRSGAAGIGSVLDIVGQVVTVIVLLQTSLRSYNSVVIPVVATYVGTVLRLLFVAICYFKYVHRKLIPVRYRTQTFEDTSEVTSQEEETVSVKSVLVFWFPLAFVEIGQRISRPLCNLFVSRDRVDGYTAQEAMQAVAVLSVCYPIGHLPYGWLNVLRTMEPAFDKRQSESEAIIPVKKIRKFNFFCFCISIMVMLVLFAIPGVAHGILAQISHLADAMVTLAIPVLHVFIFFPFPVINRATCTGLLMKRKKTTWLYPTVVVRIIFLVIALNVLPRLGVHGALMGVASLLVGFLSESLVVLIVTLVMLYREKILKNDNLITTPLETCS